MVGLPVIVPTHSSTSTEYSAEQYHDSSWARQETNIYGPTKMKMCWFYSRVCSYSPWYSEKLWRMKDRRGSTLLTGRSESPRAAGEVVTRLLRAVWPLVGTGICTRWGLWTNHEFLSFLSKKNQNFLVIPSAHVFTWRLSLYLPQLRCRRLQKISHPNTETQTNKQAKSEFMLPIVQGRSAFEWGTNSAVTQNWGTGQAAQGSGQGQQRLGSLRWPCQALAHLMGLLARARVLQGWA